MKEKRKKKKKLNKKKSYSFEYNINIYKLKDIYNTLLDNITINDEEITIYNEELFEELYDSYYSISAELYQIVGISYIPTELLSKFYIKFYSNGHDFIKDLRKSLTTVGPLDSKFYKYIKILYLANKLNVFEDTSCNVLYHSAKIEEYEIEKIKTLYQMKKNLLFMRENFYLFQNQRE